MFGGGQLKVLECKRCHKLFRSSDIHITVYIERSDVSHFCEECSFVLMALANKAIEDIEGGMGAIE